ncbi:MAG: ATP synthase F1 subunit delta [Candidatus Binatia bacterium]
MVARRYAKAVFSLASEERALEDTARQLERLAALVQDPTVGPVLRSPLLSPVRRRALAQMLAKELSLSELLSRFLGVLSDRQRLGELAAIADHFQHLYDRALGRVRITVRTARPLEAVQQEQLMGAFAHLTGKHVLPTVVLDPELLGGVLVEVEGKVYDGSVRTQLQRLAKELTRTSAL